MINEDLVKKAADAIDALHTRLIQMQQEYDAALEEGYEEAFQAITAEKDRIRAQEIEDKGESKGEVYLHIGNGGVVFEVVNKKYGPMIRMSSSHFGNNNITQELYVKKEDLLKLSLMFAQAANQKYNKPYCHAATTKTGGCCGEAEACDPPSKLNKVNIGVSSRGCGPAEKCDKDDVGTVHPSSLMSNFDILTKIMGHTPEEANNILNDDMLVKTLTSRPIKLDGHKCCKGKK